MSGFVSIEDERGAVTRKAAATALATIASLEIGALVWSAAASGYREGILWTRDVLFLGWASCAIIAQAVVVWAVVGRDRRANPAPRAILCLIIALAVGLPALVSTTPHGSKLSSVIFFLSLSLAAMSAAILIATGIGRIYLRLTRQARRTRL